MHKDDFDSCLKWLLRMQTYSETYDFLTNVLNDNKQHTTLLMLCWD